MLRPGMVSRHGGAVALPFSPDQIGGLLGWWDAAAITGLSDGDPVVTWEDSSSNNRDLTQATSSKRPSYQTNELNGLPVIRFDGTDDVMGHGADATYKHWFVVAKYNNAIFATFEGLLTGETNDSADIILVSGGNSLTYWYTGGPGGTYHKNGTSMALDAAGAAPMAAFAYMSLSLSAGWTINLQVGNDRAVSSRNWLGDVAEIIAYDSVLSTGDRQDVEAYLAAKYAI